jgi:hypothetical protein
MGEEVKDTLELVGITTIVAVEDTEEAGINSMA